jgi:cobalt transporter subunit CbtA
MLKRIFSAGLLAGLTSGLVIAILLHVFTAPLILEAEVYEAAAGQPKTVATGHAGHSHHEHNDAGEAAEWKPANGIERTLSTSIATIVTAIGFALVLLAAMLFAGEEITPLRTLAWAAGGFAATGLATGLGLAPELPGSAGADLILRQSWWAATAFATALGLYLLLCVPLKWARVSGLSLIVLPHLTGAPHPHLYSSTVPAELAAQFAASSLAIHAALWAFTGVSAGYFWLRSNHSEASL